MNSMNTYYRMSLLLIHIVIGFIFYNFSYLSTYFGIFIILSGTYLILSKTSYNKMVPLYLSGYIVGSEVLFRMCKSSLFWEFGKYSIIYFIILGFIRNGSKLNLNLPILLYFILLLPSIINIPLDSFSFWRQSISFNLSGPACLAFVTCYIYNIYISKEGLIDILFYSMLPIVSMSIIIFIRMPDIDSYKFLPYSNPVTSGGYGPNQVSTIFGFMILGLSFAQFNKKYISGYKAIDLFFILVFIGLGLITFSRGGLFASIISISIAYSYYFFYDQNKIQMFFKIIFVIIISSIAWFAIVSITEGSISKRYALSEGGSGEKLYLDLTGRAEIYKLDVEIFYKYFFNGAGPGQANKLRFLLGYGQSNVAAHTEFSRMLAEHGVLGLISLLILAGIPVSNIILSSCSYNAKVIKILFGTMAILTMFHSAMRISMPCFIYGFSVINLKE